VGIIAISMSTIEFGASLWLVAAKRYRRARSPGGHQPHRAALEYRQPFSGQKLNFTPELTCDKKNSTTVLLGTY
jgi:hypothetical protein